MCIRDSSKGYTYMGLGCPTGGGFECWRGNDVSKSSKVLEMKECTGTPLTNIGNNKNNGHCSGFPSGTFSVDYKGLSVPLGGWHREPVFDRAELIKAGDPNAPAPVPEPEPKPTSGTCVYAYACVCSQSGLSALVGCWFNHVLMHDFLCPCVHVDCVFTGELCPHVVPNVTSLYACARCRWHMLRQPQWPTAEGCYHREEYRGLSGTLKGIHVHGIGMSLWRRFRMLERQRCQQELQSAGHERMHGNPFDEHWEQQEQWGLQWVSARNIQC